LKNSIKEKPTKVLKKYRNIPDTEWVMCPYAPWSHYQARKDGLVANTRTGFIYDQSIDGYVYTGVGKAQRVVAATFFGWTPEKDTIPHHIDRNPGNNSVANLMLVTEKQHYDIHADGKGGWMEPVPIPIRRLALRVERYMDQETTAEIFGVCARTIRRWKRAMSLNEIWSCNAR
jgi:hypothetical protein